MPRLILIFGAMGLLGCFLPMHYDYEGPGWWSWWQMRHDWPAPVYAVIGAFAVATLIGLRGRRITRSRAAVAALAFGVVAYVMWPPIPMYALAGWYLMVLGAFGGCATALATVLASPPDPGEPV
jgi:hypothetical protein